MKLIRMVIKKDGQVIDAGYNAEIKEGNICIYFKDAKSEYKCSMFMGVGYSIESVPKRTHDIYMRQLNLVIDGTNIGNEISMSQVKEYKEQNKASTGMVL